MMIQAAGWLALLPDLVGDFVDPTHVIEGERANTGNPFFFTRSKALSLAIVLQLSLLHRTPSLWLFLPNNTANKPPRTQLTRLHNASSERGATEAVCQRGDPSDTDRLKNCCEAAGQEQLEYIGCHQCVCGHPSAGANHVMKEEDGLGARALDAGSGQCAPVINPRWRKQMVH